MVSDPNRPLPFVEHESMIVHADRRPHVDHKSRMQLRRARQKARVPGFSITQPNKFDAAVELAVVHLTKKYEDEKIIRSTVDIRGEAINACRSILPKTPIGVRIRPHRNRSKY